MAFILSWNNFLFFESACQWNPIPKQRYNWSTTCWVSLEPIFWIR